LDFKTLAREAGGELANEKFGAAVFEGVSIDSRTIKEKQLFVAIKGKSNDGHRFINNALVKKGAGVLVASDYPALAALVDRAPTVVVDDTHRSMIRLAASYRNRSNADLIAITGSNGKTTTKEFVYGIIDSKCKKTYCSPGNLNNLYGLPLAIFGLSSEEKYGIFELGISIPGEMTQLADMLRPDVAVITNVGPTHLETLGTVEGVAEAKFELVDSMAPDNQVIINADDPLLIAEANKRNRRVVTFGIENRADFTARRLGIGSDGYPRLEIDGREVTVRLFGEHQAYNVLAGFAVAKTLDLDVKAEELSDIDYTFAPHRGEIENFEGLTVIADCYNANPVSMESGLKSFREYTRNAELTGRRAVAVIGDMLELGKESKDMHRNVGKQIAELDLDLVVAVGPLSVDIHEAAVAAGLDEKKIRQSKDVKQAGEVLVSDIKRGDILYFKASRGIELERLITLLKGTAFRQN
jgi:UDP-N-acetylmuramoyl-tripeptide--D-alanyl-D-alanine ligase